MWPAAGAKGKLHLSQLAILPGPTTHGQPRSERAQSRSEAQAAPLQAWIFAGSGVSAPQTWRLKFLRIRLWGERRRNNSGFYIIPDVRLKSLPSYLVTWRHHVSLRRSLRFHFPLKHGAPPPPASRSLCPSIPAGFQQRRKSPHLRPQDPLEISCTAPHPPHLEITKSLWTLLFIHSQRMEDSVF